MTLTLVFSVPAETTKPSDKEYGKLEGLTGKADSEERIHDNQGEDGATSNALDGKRIPTGIQTGAIHPNQRQLMQTGN